MRPKLFILLIFSILSSGATNCFEFWDKTVEWFEKRGKETSEAFQSGKKKVQSLAEDEKETLKKEFAARQKILAEREEVINESEAFVEGKVKEEVANVKQEFDIKGKTMQNRMTPMVDSTTKTLDGIKERIKDPNLMQNVKEELNYVKDLSYQAAQGALGKIRRFYDAQRERSEMSKKWDKESLNAKAASFLDKIEEIIEVSSFKGLPEIVTFCVTSNVNVFDRKKLEVELEKMKALSDQEVSATLLQSLLKGLKSSIDYHVAQFIAEQYEEKAAAAAGGRGGRRSDNTSPQHLNDNLHLDIDLKYEDEDEEDGISDEDQQKDGEIDEQLTLENLSEVEVPERILESILNDIQNEDYREKLERQVMVKLKMLRKIVL
ncbi:MAG: hypothetical protein MHMPM18_004398 [Marteilia pararefringens]